MKLVDNARGEEFLLKIMVLFTAHPWFTFVTSCLGGYFPLIIGFPLFLYKTKTGQTTMTSQASCIVFLHTGVNIPFSGVAVASSGIAVLSSSFAVQASGFTGPFSGFAVPSVGVALPHPGLPFPESYAAI